MQRFLWNNRPFRLLLYLEWVLLGIAVLAASHPPPLSPPPHFRPLHPPYLPPDLGFHLPIAAIASIGILGLVGLRLPAGSRWLQVLYTGLGFGLSWLAVFLNERRASSFSALLLVVVIRACLMFPWGGRLLVALLAYGSFLIMLLLSVHEIRSLGIPLDRPPLPNPPQGTLSQLAQSLVTSLTLNSALLFGLVLVFVLLLVGALLAEHESRQELALANSRLRQYALLIENQATLQERNRIAREIHDSLGHSLTAQSIQLEYVAMLLSEDTKQADHYLQAARQLGKEALQNVRQSVAALRTHPLQGKSLAIALTKLLQKFEQTTSIQVETQINLSSKLPEEIATALYRIIQEALTNISKHSNATHLFLQLTEHKIEINLQLEDNGRGFDPNANTTGFGLQGMRERAETLGGTFRLNSRSGQGCQLQVAIPLYPCSGGGP